MRLIEHFQQKGLLSPLNDADLGSKNLIAKCFHLAAHRKHRIFHFTFSVSHLIRSYIIISGLHQFICVIC